MLASMPTISAITFDLDGTLLDTLDDLAHAMNSVLEARGYPPHATPRYKILVGDGMDVLVQRVLPESARTPTLVCEVMEAFRRAYGACWDAKTRPYVGVPQLLDALVARDVSCLVLSNKPHAMTVEAVNGLLSSWSFLDVRGAQEGIPKKPDPAAMKALLREHVLDPQRMLYVGDTNVDMRTAKAAGLVAVGVTWGFRDEAELREGGADHIIHAPAELLALL